MPLTTFRVSPGAAAIGKLTQAFDKVRSKQDQQRLLQESDDDLSPAARLADDTAQAATGETVFAGALPSTSIDASSGEAKPADSWPAAPWPIEEGATAWPSEAPQAAFPSSWPAAVESSGGEAAVASEWSSVTVEPDRKALAREAQSASKLSGPASMAAAAANGPKAAMGAALRFGNRMRSAATGSTCASKSEETQIGHADASVENTPAETLSSDVGAMADVGDTDVADASSENQATAVPGLGSSAVEGEKETVALETCACDDGAVPPDANASEAAGLPAVAAKGSIIKMPVIKIKTGQMPKDLSKVSELASRATKSASAQAVAMGAVFRKGGQMRSAAASGSKHKLAAEDVIEEDCAIEATDAEVAESAGHGSEECAPVVSLCSEGGQEAAPVCSVDATESGATVAAEEDDVKQEAVAAQSADAFEGGPAVVNVDVADGGVDVVGGEDAEASGFPQAEADANAASEERAAPSPVLETGTEADPPQPWLLKAQARSGVQALLEGCSKLRDREIVAEDRATVL